jgi:hypothetical protein
VRIIRGLSVGIITENYQRERLKARRVNPTLRLMPSPNYGTRACKKKEGDAHGSLFERKILGNYEWELSVDYRLRIISRNYKLCSISSRRKVEIYMDTSVSKNSNCNVKNFRWKPLCISFDKWLLLGN